MEVSLFVSDKSLLPPPIPMIEKIFAVSSAWGNRPDKVMRLDYEAHKEQNVHWEDMPALLEEPLSTQELLFVYALAPEGTNPFCVALMEHPPQAVYAVSIPYDALPDRNAEDVERWIKRLYSMFDSYSECILAVASETELPSDRSAADVLVHAFSSVMAADWVIAPQHLMQQQPLDLSEAVVEEFDDAIMVRLRDLSPAAYAEISRQWKKESAT